MTNQDREKSIEAVKSGVSCKLFLEKSKGGEYCCPFCGSGTHRGNKSDGALKVFDDNKWTCFACPPPADKDYNSGDVLDLIQQVEGVGFDDALQIGLKYLGKSGNMVQKPVSQPVRKQSAKDFTQYYIACRNRLMDPEAGKKYPEAIQYLEVERRISHETAERFKIGYDPEADPLNAPGGIGKVKYPCRRIIIPVNSSYYIGRMIDDVNDDNQKRVVNNAGGKIGIFNEEALQKSDVIFVVEGAFDAMSIEEVGQSAVATNSTSNIKQLIESVKASGTSATFVISFDNDENAETAKITRSKEKQLSDELSKLGVKNIIANVSGKHKDANDALVNDYETFRETVESIAKQARETALQISNAPAPAKKESASAAPVIIETGSGTLTVNQASEMKPADVQAKPSSKDILKHISPLSSRNHSLESLPEKEYLFKPYFPMGKFSIITADPGTGKTKAVDAIIALVTTGGSLCGIKCDRPGNVLIFSMEDDDSDHIATIAHCGGDISKVICPNSDDDDIDYFAQNQLTFGSPEIEEAIKEYRPSLVVFDPYQKWVGGKTDTDKANKLSVALTPLTLLSKKYNCHIIVVAHNIKAQTLKLQHKFMGSIDFVGEARSAMMIVKDPDKPSENENIIIHVKSNNRLGKSIRYRIDSIPGNEDYATIRWLGLDDYTERDYMLANKTMLQNKIQSMTEINDDDPMVSMILNIVSENHDIKEIRISNYDFSQCYFEYTGKCLKGQVAREIKRVQTYLEEKHGISVISSDARTLMSFKFKGKMHDPHTSQNRCVRIQKGVAYTPGQQMEIDTEE